MKTATFIVQLLDTSLSKHEVEIMARGCMFRHLDGSDPRTLIGIPTLDDARALHDVLSAFLEFHKQSSTAVGRNRQPALFDFKSFGW